MIEGSSNPRADWEEAAREMRERGEDGLVDEPEWVWE